MIEAQHLDINKVSLALKVITGAPNNDVSYANNYLANCEKQPMFASLLLQICLNSTQPTVELGSLLLLTNVIKRIWNTKRKRQNSQFQAQKDSLRIGFINLYKLKMHKYCRHLNQLFRFLSRQQFSHQYLYNFVQNNLLQRIPYLTDFDQIKNIFSTIRTIIKEYCHKKLFSHSPNNNMIILLQRSLQLSQQMHQMDSNAINYQIKLQCLRNIDQTVLCLLQATSISSYESFFTNILFYIIQFCTKLINNQKKGLQKSVAGQKYLQCIFQELIKIQNIYPLHFADFLEDYCKFILQLISDFWYTQEQLILNLLLLANKPFITYVYTHNEQQFMNSVYNKNADQNIIKRQSTCYKQFKSVFSSQIVNQLLIFLMRDVLSKFKTKDIFNNINSFEQYNQIQNVSEFNLMEMGIYLCRNIIKCFKMETKQTVLAIVSNIINDRQLFIPAVELVLIFPKIYELPQMPTQQILRIGGVLLYKKQYVWLARLINNYSNLFQNEHITQFFSILAQVVASSDCSPAQVYQCAVTMNTILNEYADYISLPCLKNCFVNLFRLIDQYKTTPTALWPLIQIIRNMLSFIPNSSITPQIIFQAIKAINQVRFIDELIGCAFADLLQSLIGCTQEYLKHQFYPQNPAFHLFATCIAFIVNNINNPNIQSFQIIYCLWCNTIAHYPTVLQQTLSNYQQQYQNQQLRNLLKDKYSNFIQIEPYILTSTIQQYLITGLIKLSSQQFIQIYQQIQINNNQRVQFGLCSLYLTYSIITQTYIDQIFIKIAQMLQKISSQVSPIKNCIRSMIYLIISEHIISYSPAIIQPLLLQNNFYNVYVQGMQYVSNKVIFKVNAAAVLKCMAQIANYDQLLKDNIDPVIKAITDHVKTIDFQEIIRTQCDLYCRINKIKETLLDSRKRKAKLHFSGALNQAASADCTKIYKNVFQTLFLKWDWGEDDLQARYSTTLKKKIITLLNSNNAI